MFGLEGFLDTLASGGSPDLAALTKRKKNAPQMGSLLPSELAMGDLGAGAAEALASMGGNSSPGALGSAMGKESGGGGGGKSAAMGALMGGLKGIVDATKNVQPFASPPPSSDTGVRQAAVSSAMDAAFQAPPPMQIGSLSPYLSELFNSRAPVNQSVAYPVEHSSLPDDEEEDRRRRRWDIPIQGTPGMAYGGIISPGGMARVGNEEVYVDEYGNAHVISNPETAAEDAVAEELIDINRPVDVPAQNQPPMASLLSLPDSMTSPMPNGIEQTMDDGSQAMIDAYSQQSRPNLGALIPQIDPNSEEGLYAQLEQIQNEKPSKWRDAGFGALQGLVNWTNKTNNPIVSYSEMRKNQKSQPIRNKIGMIDYRKQKDARLAYDKARTDTIYIDDERLKTELERKIIKDERDYEIKTETLNWKKEDRDRYYELEDVKNKARERRDARTYEMAVRKQKELERHNRVTEGQTGKKIDNTMKLGELRVRAQKEIAIIKEAEKNKRSAEAIAARERLARIKAEKEALDSGVEPEFYGPVIEP